MHTFTLTHILTLYLYFFDTHRRRERIEEEKEKALGWEGQIFSIKHTNNLLFVDLRTFSLVEGEKMSAR